nr:sulfotransferase domain-containing protein [Terriglobales bacterium]
RLIKTHEPYQKEYRKAIYLVRDVRDVILSEFAYQKALGWIPDDFELFLGRFLDGEVNPFLPWQEHVPGWLGSAISGTPKLLVIKFEDLRRDTEQAVVRALEFLDVVVEPGVVRAAIANNSVQKMQEKEARQPQLSSTAPKATGSEETRFIRSGSIGGWRNRLTADQVQRIEQRSGPLLAQLGYPVGDAAKAVNAAAANPPVAQPAVR